MKRFDVFGFSKSPLLWSF